LKELEPIVMKPLNTNQIVLTLATVGLLLTTAAPVAVPAASQTPPAGSASQAPGARGGANAPAGQPGQLPGGRGGGLYPALETDDTTGFVSIFDGKTLSGWDGDPRFWRVENGEIVGETTAEKVVTLNNFLIWRGGTVKDFELKVEFRMNGTNSGVQYRSVELPDVGKWVLKGYQADIDFAEGFVGNIHEERGRSLAGEGHVVLSKRGQVTRIIDGPAYKLVGTIQDSTLLRGVMNVNGWNQYHIIARGPVLMQLLNGQLMAVAIDEDAKHAVAEGLLGFQMHVGPSFKIQYRNVMLRKL
jgi:3-keto-disaccharide hydrolase